MTAVTISSRGPGRASFVYSKDPREEGGRVPCPTVGIPVCGLSVLVTVNTRMVGQRPRLAVSCLLGEVLAGSDRGRKRRGREEEGGREDRRDRESEGGVETGRERKNVRKGREGN